MKTLELVKVTRNTHLLKKGQKAWVCFGTGALAAAVITRFKGQGRWIKCWVHFPDKDKRGLSFQGGKSDAKYIGKVEVSDDFFRYLKRVSRGMID